MLVTLGECGGIFGDTLRGVLVNESGLKPVRTSVVDKIDDRTDAKLLDHVWQDLINPAPVELARLGLDLVPRDAPAQSLETEVAAKFKVLAPVRVVAHQFVLVQRAVAG